MDKLRVYRIFSDEWPNSIFSASLISSVIVIADSEKMAFELAKEYKEDFVCDFNNLEIEVISDYQIGVINVEYFNN